MADFLDIDAMLKAALAGGRMGRQRYSDELQLPDLTPEERESLLSRVTSGALGGLQYVGETLGKPSAALLGSLSGDPSQLMNLIPFSDAMGLTDPTKRVSGRDLLEKAGLLDKNQEGLDWGDAAGFLVEVALDPLNLLALGAGPKTLTQLGRALASGGAKAVDKTLAVEGTKLAEVAGNKITKYLKFSPTPADTIAGIRGSPTVMGEPLGEMAGLGLKEAMAGEMARTGAKTAPLRGIASFGLEGTPYGWAAKKLGLATSETPFFGRNIVPKWATGEIPAQMLEKLYYGKLSPVRMVRGLLDSRAGEQARGLAQMAHDIERGESIYGMANSIEKANTLRHGFDGLSKTYKEMTTGMNPEDVQDLEKLLRSTAETPNFSMSDTVKNLEFLAGKGNLQGFTEEFHRLAEEAARMPREMGAILRGQGLPLAMLDDAFVPYTPRRMKQELIKGSREAYQKAMGEYTQVTEAIKSSGLDLADILKQVVGGLAWSQIEGLEAAAVKAGLEPADMFERLKIGVPDREAFEGKRFLKTNPWFSETRNNVWRDVPGGTAMVNIITAIPWIVGRIRNLVGADAHFAKFSGALEHAGGGRLGQAKFWADAKTMGEVNNIPFADIQSRVKGVWELAKFRQADASELYDEVIKATGMKPREIELMIAKGPTEEQLAKLNLAGDKLAASDGMFARTYPGAMSPSTDMMSVIKKGKPNELRHYHSETLAELEAAIQNRTYERQLHIPKSEEITEWGGRRFDKEGLEKISREIFQGTITAETLAGAAKGTSMALPPGAEQFALRGPTEYSQDIAANYVAKISGVHIEKAREMVKRMELMDPRVLETGAPLASFDTMDEALGHAKLMYDQHKGAREFAVTEKNGKFLLTAPEGMFNRGLVEDTIDYMRHSYGVQSGLSAINRMFRDPRIAIQRDGVVSNNLAQAWTHSMGLNEEGLINLINARGGKQVTTFAEATEAASMIEVPADVVRGATKFMSAHTQPDAMKGLLEGVDRWLATFKGGVTMPRVAFHVRNRISGMYSNWQMGQWSARSEKWAMRLAKGGDIDMGEAGVMTAKELHRELLDHRVLDNTSLSDIAGADTPLNPPSILGAIKGSFQDATGKVTPASVGRAADPFTIVGGFDVPGGAKDAMGFFKSGASIRERLGAIKRGAETLTHGTAEESHNVLLKAGEAAYKKVEYYNRVAPYLELRAQGLTAGEAAQRVKMAQFDYADLTNFERSVMKRVIPFYTFSRKNLPYQLRMLIENPGGRTAQTVRAFNDARDETKDTGFVPRYLAESLAIPIGGTPESRRYISVSGTLPIEQALNNFAFTNNLPDLKRMAQKAGGQLNFMLQQPIESITDTQLWSGRRKSSLYQEPTGSPTLNALLYSGMVPVVPNPTSILSTGGPFLDPRKSLLQAAGSAVVGGVKVTDVNPNSRLLEARDIIERTLPGEIGVGQFKRLYAKDIGRMTGDTPQRMALYNSIAAELQKKHKQEELRKAALRR